jgi:hypothetical protein
MPQSRHLFHLWNEPHALVPGPSVPLRLKPRSHIGPILQPHPSDRNA